jgi:hypothetical protein
MAVINEINKTAEGFKCPGGINAQPSVHLTS